MKKTILSLLIILICSGFVFSSEKMIGTGPIERFIPDVGSDASVISFGNGISFDTKMGEPALPSGYRIFGYPKGVWGYYIVQCKGPIEDGWTDGLWNAGAKVYTYLPNYSFVVKMDNAVYEKVSRLSYVRWIGLFQPAYKVVEEGLFSSSGTGSLVMQLFPDGDIDGIERIVIGLGGVIEEKTVTEFARVIRAKIDLNKVSEISRIPDVLALHTWSEPKTFNQLDQWVIQQGWRAVATDTSRPVWRRNIRGQNQIIGYHDTGINFNVVSGGHCAFRDPLLNITGPGDYPTHRKVVAYKVYPGNAFGDCSQAGYHGTHVGGTIAGDDTIANGSGPDPRDGMALKARINFLDIATATCGLNVGTDLTALHDSAARGNSAGPVRQSGGSWGWSSSLGQYLTQDATTDAWLWKNKNFADFWAAGNSGTSGIAHPACAKNGITVGATLNGTSSNQLASFSSQGPTQDGRYKPTIVCPGDGVTLYSGLQSADGATTCGYKGMSGTSMAQPTANGAGALVRQYLREGWYPTGRKRPADSLNPSAALLKAMLVASADSGIGSFVPPVGNIGYGRIDLDSVLYFDTLGTDARRLAVVDNPVGIGTGQFANHTVSVNSSALPLRIALVWTDSAAAAGANPTLVNDLNLDITSPTSVNYRGNQMSGWRSTPNPATWDNRNVEEIARIVSPPTGVWTIRVRGQNVPSGRCPYALVVTGGIGPITGVEQETKVIAGVPRENILMEAKPNPTAGETKIIFSLAGKSKATVSVYNSTGQLVRTLVSGMMDAGLKSVVWDGKDELGRNVSAGLYFYRLVVGDKFEQTNKLVILR